jgi:prepilin-type N-terminal cleavage/methylation domain-containing protein/prepilin-type processing-associated H-X9-DG protein
MHHYIRFPASGCRARHRRAGFTLFEILVVVAIIGILAALLFPALARVRENGRSKSCLSNMKQLGMAFQQYTMDYNRRYPGAGVYFPGYGGHPGGWAPGNGHWVSGPNNPLADLASQEPVVDASSPTGYRVADVKSGALYPYVKSETVYVCPSNSDGEKKRLSYTMNCGISMIHGTRITEPSDIVVLVDEAKANDGYFFAVDNAKAGSGGNSTDALVDIHNGGGNLLFADGHAKFFTFESFRIDDSPKGKENKWRDSGSPRFHDRTFGPWGSVKLAGATVDTCNATQRVP